MNAFEKPLTRRGALTLIAVTAGGGMLMSRSAFAQLAGGDAGSLISGADVCVLVPEVTEGPYYFDPALVRSDITEGRPGLATALRMQVVDASCRPIEGARVDVWHCDATGVYSGYDAGEGETFMRGTQFADANGVVEFATVYPGWYTGRTVHIHFKVFLDATNVLTGQIFFPEEVSDFVYASYEPYTARPGRDMTNAADGIAQQAGEASVALVENIDGALLAALVVGVDPGAVSQPQGFGAMYPPPRR
ncbi:MAG: intradiol ring-cleavage dioxygenase [Bauldia sp.]|nr:intradiol ring-cleavage dioxygenase [Bauldia sp.]